MSKSPLTKITIKKKKNLNIKLIKQGIIELLKISDTIEDKMLKVATENDEYVITETETLEEISKLLEKTLLKGKILRNTLKIEAASFKLFLMKYNFKLDDKQTENIFVYPDTQTNQEIEEESKTQSIDDRLPTKRKLRYSKGDDITEYKEE